MKAIILAAGQGTRLRPHTDDRPKCLVEVLGKPLLAWQIAGLRAAGITDIGIVTGYRADMLQDFGLTTFHNPRFDHTNMVVSLMCAEPWLVGNDDLIISYGDIVYEPHIVRQLINSTAPLATTIDHQWLRLWQMRNEDPLLDAETLKLSSDGTIAELGKKPQSLSDIEAQYMGLIRFSRDFLPTLLEHHGQLPEGPHYDGGKDKDNMYMTTLLQSLIDAGHPLRAVPVEGGWVEVDTVEDLDLYSRLAASGELRVQWDHTALEA